MPGLNGRPAGNSFGWITFFSASSGKERRRQTAIAFVRIRDMIAENGCWMLDLGCWLKPRPPARSASFNQHPPSNIQHPALHRLGHIPMIDLCAITGLAQPLMNLLGEHHRSVMA